MSVSIQSLRRHAAGFPGGPFDPEAELRRAEELGIGLIGLGSPGYPELLRSIGDPPEALYVRGDLGSGSRAVGIVGSRRPTPYGLRMARELAAQCASSGITVVSGLARGIDAQAHAAALKAGGTTWAVLGSGLDRIYPPEHEELAQSILRFGGALVSEVPLSGAPVAANFPRRNRILSGLCWGVIVVEGDPRSGSLITARCALEQGRCVFAVPGPADSPLSEGPHELLRQGAVLTRRLQDVLDELPILGASGAVLAPAGREDRLGHTLEQQKVLKLLGPHPLSLDDLATATGWDLPRLAHVLSELEIQSLISALPGQRYACI